MRNKNLESKSLLQKYAQRVIVNFICPIIKKSNGHKIWLYKFLLDWTTKKIKNIVSKIKHRTVGK